MVAKEAGPSRLDAIQEYVFRNLVQRNYTDKETEELWKGMTMLVVLRIHVWATRSVKARTSLVAGEEAQMVIE